MKKCYLSLCLTIMVFTLGYGQDGPTRIGELPLFQALNGEMAESGILIPKPDATPIQGGAKSVGQPAIAGLWYQIDGHAKYGPAEWLYRWMFVFTDTAALKVHARYIDTVGQKIDYEGFYDTESNRLQLVGPMRDGTARYQLTLLEDGKVRIESIFFDADDNAVVTYTAENAPAE